MVVTTSNLSDLLITTKDGDWGKDEPQDGFVPYRVIRGGDFPDIRNGDTLKVPRCYLDKKTVDRRTLQEKDIIIETAGGTRDRPTGRTIFITKRILEHFDLPVTCASFARFLRIDPTKAVPEYIYWYLQYLYESGEMWQHQVQHTGIARFQYTRFAKSVEIPLPSRDAQHAIAHILGTLEDKIEINRQINQTLEAMAQAIFKSWFVDFEPVKAKIAAIEAGEDDEGVTRAAMRAISGKTNEELDQLQAEQPDNYTQLKTTAELFPAAMQDSELGKIPKGWEIKELKEFGEIVCGKTPSKKEMQYYENGEFPFIKIPDMRNQIFPVKTEDKLSKNGAESISKKKLPPFSVCVSCIATVGMVCITCEDSYTNQQINSIIPNEHLTPYYLYFEMKELNDKLHLWASGGSATLNLNTNEFSKLKIVSPSREIFHNFSDTVDPLFKKVLLNSLEIESLSNLRDSLLPKLLSGELSIDAAKLAGE